MKRLNSIIWGLILIAAGVIWALDAIGIAEIDIFFEGWWTLFIILPSAVSLVTSRDKISALIGLAIGIVLLLCARDILEFSIMIKLVIPAIIVIIGLRMIISSFANKKTDEAVREMEKKGDDIDNVFSLFASKSSELRGKVFRGAQINAVFGSVDYDLRGAVIEPDSAIGASAIFGTIEITVPENVRVRVKSSAFFGGTTNKASRADDGASNIVTLYVSAFSLFGGIDIK